MPPKILLNIPEIASQESSLRRTSGVLKEAGDKYKKKMDAMSSVWQGSSGKSFAEAAGRVEAGFVINRSVLEQMLYDVAASQKALVEQDTVTAKSVSSMSAK